MHHRSRGVGLKLFLGLMALGVALAPIGAWGQQTAAQPSLTPPAQPSLNVDRDVAPSPDPDPIVKQQDGPVQGTGLGQVQGSGGKYTLRQDAYEVVLNATVLDQGGRAIQTLAKDDFRVYEDGVPQVISGFRHEDLPVSLGILIDSSGSMYDKRAAVDQASLDLVKLSNKADEAFLVDFSWEAFIDQDFTNDVNKLQQGLSFIKSSGGTAIYDALVASADYLQKNAKHPKQVLLVVTDGEDNASSSTLEQAIRRIQDLDGPVIYCVGLLFGSDVNKGEARHARRVLESLAEQTGGAAYFPRSIKEVDGIAAQVAEDIRTQYSIAYHSTNPPTKGGYRQVHVEAKGKGTGKLSVRTRSGYFPKTSPAASSKDAGLNNPGKRP
jgi:Ca-activated chloride channel family protein